VKAGDFAYIRVQSVVEAVAAFRACEGEPRYLAGGQSLLPSMNLRLQSPTLLIDIARIESMRGVERRGGEIRVGALTRHAEILASPVIAREAPLLFAAAPWVAHPAIRNKGTIGGSLALADPASEFPAVALALGARIELDDGDRKRFVPAEDFFLDLYETAIEPGEILTAVWFPCATPETRFAFDELSRRRGDYALVGMAAAARLRGEVVEDIRLVFFSVGPTPTRVRNAEAALRGKTLSETNIATCQAALAQDLADASEDVQTSAATRRHLAGVLLRRQLAGLRPARAA
jgi:aerobic carbon-monoxide dehydrogenase medium subunit